MSGQGHFVFGKKNYIAMAIGFALVVIGFMLMSGGKSDDPNVFVGEEVFSARRITLAPFTVILGFIVVGVGIMLKPNDSEFITAKDSEQIKD